MRAAAAAAEWDRPDGAAEMVLCDSRRTLSRTRGPGVDAVLFVVLRWGGRGVCRCVCACIELRRPVGGVASRLTATRSETRARAYISHNHRIIHCILHWLAIISAVRPAGNRGTAKRNDSDDTPAMRRLRTRTAIKSSKRGALRTLAAETRRYSLVSSISQSTTCCLKSP